MSDLLLFRSSEHTEKILDNEGKKMEDLKGEIVATKNWISV